MTVVLFYLGACPVIWLLHKQKVVALSSCEAEYIAASTVACQGVWLGRLLSELKGTEQSRVELMVDNKSAISLSKNPIYHDRSKHIDTRYHYIHECVEKGRIKVKYMTIGEQLTDLLTKPLGRVKFLELRQKVGAVDVRLGNKF